MQRSFVALLSLLVIGCGSECDQRRNSERVEHLGAIEVHESLRITSCFHDAVFERVITVHDASGATRELGRYSDEGDGGLTHIARVENTLAIFSGAHVYTVDMGAHAPLASATTHAFSPYDAAAFATRFPNVNGHYDLQASSLAIEGTMWTLRYERLPNHGDSSEGGPIEFISQDAGETFAVR